MINPDSLMRIKHLHLRAKAIVEGFFNGLHRSPFHGSSVEFSEYRSYTSGDDLRALDWKLLARSDRYYVKKFEDETTRRCYLVLDRSRSMAYRSIDYTKLDYARTLCATLAYFLGRTRDNVGLMTFDQQVGDFIPAQNRVGHLRRLMVALARDVQGEATDIETPLSQIAALVARRGLVVLVSDFLSPIATLRRHLASLRSRGHEVLLIRILDPAEVDLGIDRSVMVRDLESGKRLHLNPDQVRNGYQQKFQQHAAELQQICDAVGVQLQVTRTDQPMQDMLFEFVQAANRQRGSSSRRRMLAASQDGNS